VSVIAPPALRITGQPDNPPRKTISSCAELGNRQRQSSAQRLGCRRTVPPPRRADMDPRLLHLANGPTESGRPAGCPSADHRPVREVGPSIRAGSHAGADLTSALLRVRCAAPTQPARPTRSAFGHRDRTPTPVWPS
jgi:hypothetical protein